ncbi:MAG: hypothetical protein ACKVW3_01985 [Phycisphaerales bacterium]
MARQVTIRDGKAKRIGVLLFALGPLAVLAFLCVLMWQSMKNPLMHEPPKGAGAGKTGMSNEYGGIGEKPAAR